MRKKRKPLLGQTRFYFGVVMSSVMLITSCKKQIVTTSEDVNAIASMEKNISLTGEDWFKSIIYADGPATSHLPSLSGIVESNSHFTAQQWEDYRKAEADLIKQIKIGKPDYFNQFKIEMESNDPVRIASAIQSSKQIVYDALKIQLAKDGYDLDQETQSYMNANGIQMQPNSLGIIILIVILVAISVAINLTYQYTKTWSKDNPPPATPNTGELSAEILAGEIANL